MAAQLLNLDLDFFVDDIAHWQTKKNPRLSPEHFHAWKVADLRAFLEHKCGLVRGQPIPGRFGTHHDAAFDYIGEMYLDSGSSVAITHVDAHADQGLGDSGWVYLTFDLLHQPVARRTQPRRGIDALNLGNYLAFAIGCHWVERIDMVCHPKGGDDLMSYHFKDFDSASGFIQLKAFNPSDKHLLGVGDIERIKVLAYEPDVPFTRVELGKFEASVPFTHAFLAHSPNYTPRSADALIGVFADYIDFK